MICLIGGGETIKIELFNDLNINNIIYNIYKLSIK